VIFALAQITAQIDSEPNAIQAYREVIETLTPLVQAQPRLTALQALVGQALINLSMLQRSTGRTAEAEASLERAHAIFQELAGSHPTSTEYRVGLAMTETRLGGLLRDREQPAEALASLERARDLLEASMIDHPDVSARAELASVHLSLGVSRRAAGRFVEALADYQRSRDLLESLFRDDPTVVRYQVALANCYYNLGILYLAPIGVGTDPLASFERAREIQEALVRDHPSVTEYQASLAKTHGNIGTIHRIGSRWAQARSSLERTRDIFAALARYHPEVTSYRSDLALTHYNLGILQAATKQHAEAIAGFQQARDSLETLAREHPERLDTWHLLGATCHELGSCLEQLGRREEALSAYRQAIAHHGHAFSQAPQGTPFRRDVVEAIGDHHVALARLQAALGRQAEALGSLERARRILEAQPDLIPNELYRLACLDSLCSALVGGGRPSLTTAEEARRRFLADQAMDTLRRAVRAGFTDLARFREDHDLDPLRARSDFQLLMLDLAFPANLFEK
jgi:tetratricopeptide (TPR) repeat protein